ncbi:MAG: shikimate dehydrogenase [Sphingomonadales bacterium]|nr:shikimate dehydrogenase [Sphingomonadales bacterium]MDE2171312.1 shikimate dehydrogenase [Sphingomonadales bacterium]
MTDPTPTKRHQPLGIGAGRVLAGLLGRGITESRTPWMHEQEADAQGLRMVYSLLDFSDRGWSDGDLAQVLDAVQRVGFAGVNVTFPFKQAVLPLLDELSPGAAAIGAVNTIAFVGGRRIGHNTDVSGFAGGFAEGLPGVAMDRVLQLGCGGAGSATAHALLSTLGAGQLALFDTDAARVATLAEQLTAIYGEGRVTVAGDAAEAATQADGIVNATPIGMAKFPGLPLPVEALRPGHWLAEIIYFPLETELLKAARALGCRTVSGQGMAVGQAADAFSIFTGQAPDRARMAASFAAFAQQ